MRELPLDIDDPAYRRAVTHYLFIPDRSIRAEMAIVFGMTRWRRPLQRALALYDEGSVQRLLFTGGFNARIGAIEAEEMARAAEAAGVPGSDIVVDPQARNTHENAVNAAKHLGGVDSAVLVAIHYHARRVRLTSERVFPSAIRLGMATYPSVFYGTDDWHRTERGRGDVLTELRKLRDRHPEDFAELAREIALSAREAAG